MSDGIGDRILKLRKHFGLSQEAFAHKLRISQRHVSQIEKGRTASDQLIAHISLVFNTTESWLKTGEGEMFVSPKEVVKDLITRFGDKVFYEAIMSVVDDHALAILTPRAGRGIDPELDRMYDILVDIWTLGDDDLKAWARVQFNRAFPDDMIDQLQKKRAGNQGRESTA